MRHSTRVKRLLVVLLLALGCSGPSGRVKVIGVAEVDFQSPKAFDGSGCEGDWDKLSLDGTVWNIDHTFPGGSYAGVVRFDGIVATATYNDSEPAAILVDKHELFWYRAETSRVSQRTFYGCTRPAPGRLTAPSSPAP